MATVPQVSVPVSNQASTSNRWGILAGGCLMNLAFGNIYGWSVFVAPLEKEFGWKRSDTSLVFTIAVFMTGATFLLSGWIYDKWGPKVPAFVGGILMSLSFYLSVYTQSLHYLYLVFGVLGGFGAGLGCAVIIPVIGKWFPDKRGLAVGLIIGAYGGSSAIFGPLIGDSLIPAYGLATTFKILSVVFLLMTFIGAIFLKNPPPKYRPEGWTPTALQASRSSSQHFTLGEALLTRSYQMVWLGFVFGASAGMMVISQLVPFARSRGIASATLASSALIAGAVGNVAGRILSGWVSDKLNRLTVLRLMVALSAVFMPVLYAAGTNSLSLYVVVIIVYYCYGTLLSVIPAICADFWGATHSGKIYGFMFTAWGTAGIVGPYLAGRVFDNYHDYRYAFYTASALAIIALACFFIAKAPKSVPSNADFGLAAGSNH